MEIKNKREIKRAILDRETVTIPQIQREFNLGYYEAKTIINELTEDDKIQYKEGVIYQIQTEDEELDVPNFKDPFKTRSSRFEKEKNNPFDFSRKTFAPSEERKKYLNENRLVTSFANRVYGATIETCKKIAKLGTLSTSTLKEAVNKVIEIKEQNQSILKVYTEIKTTVDLKLLKYEFIEGLLKNNNFKTKKEWVSKFQSECDFLKPYLPIEIKEVLENALVEFKSFTLKNILEAKKLAGVGDSSDDD